MLIPDFSLLILPHEQWPIDEYEVNEEEYQNIKLLNVLKAESEENTNDKQKQKPYGPVGFPSRLKFDDDLTKCVNVIFAREKIPITYEFTSQEEIQPNIAQKTQEIWNTGNGFIADNQKIFLISRVSMASFLQEHLGDGRDYATYFREAINTITPYWEDVVFDPTSI